MIIDRNISSSSSVATYNVEQDCVLNIHATLNANYQSLLSINNVAMGSGTSNQYVYIDITGEPCKAGTVISVTNGSARISGFTLE